LIIVFFLEILVEKRRNSSVFW